MQYDIGSTVAFHLVESNMIMVVRGKLIEYEDDGAVIEITHVNGSRGDPKFKSAIGKHYLHTGRLLSLVN